MELRIGFLVRNLTSDNLLNPCKHFVRIIYTNNWGISYPQ